MKAIVYSIFRRMGLISIVGWWEQRKLGLARVARFKAFCKSHGLRKINGKWIKE